MKPEIKKIKLKELEAFVNTESFKDLKIIPISTPRVHSYLANPHALPDDTVLYLCFINAKLIAFRTLFADCAFTDSEIIRFGWCSGNWVHPDYRRKGFSELLLREAYSDWDQKLMFTNYAPNSENLYLKTGWFKPIHRFEGARAYLFPKTTKLLAARNSTFPSKIIFPLLDFSIGIFSSVRILFYKAPKQSKTRFELTGEPDAVCYEFLKNNRPPHLFKRYEKELRWIFANPWITASESKPGQEYPFSWCSKNFRYLTVKIFNKEKLSGFCIFSVKEDHLKTLYFACPDELVPDLGQFLKSYSKKHKIGFVTVYKKELADYFLERKFPFLRVKKYGQKIYSTFDLPTNSKPVFQDGDGDVIFT